MDQERDIYLSEMIGNLPECDNCDTLWSERCGYKEAVRDIYSKMNQYAFSSFACSKIYKHCPEAFVKGRRNENCSR